jgi:hypothetical protein
MVKVVSYRPLLEAVVILLLLEAVVAAIAIALLLVPLPKYIKMLQYAKICSECKG